MIVSGDSDRLPGESKSENKDKDKDKDEDKNEGKSKREQERGEKSLICIYKEKFINIKSIMTRL
jgi:hypothetical protein